MRGKWQHDGPNQRRSPKATPNSGGNILFYPNQVSSRESLYMEVFHTWNNSDYRFLLLNVLLGKNWLHVKQEHQDMGFLLGILQSSVLLFSSLDFGLCLLKKGDPHLQATTSCCTMNWSGLCYTDSDGSIMDVTTIDCRFVRVILQCSSA